MAEIMRACGSLVHFWSMYGERKNTELKDTANTSSHICSTIAIKSQLQQCYLKECSMTVFSDVVLGRVDSEMDFEIQNLISNINFAKTFRYIYISGKKVSTCIGYNYRS